MCQRNYVTFLVASDKIRKNESFNRFLFLNIPTKGILELINTFNRRREAVQSLQLGWIPRESNPFFTEDLRTDTRICKIGRWTKLKTDISRNTNIDTNKPNENLSNSAIDILADPVNIFHQCNPAHLKNSWTWARGK